MWRWDQQEPFGVNVPDENPSGLGIFEQPLRFPGQYADKETNLAYNVARDYDSAIGRYIQSDPIGLAGGINAFAYANLSPLSFWDLDGRAPTNQNQATAACSYYDDVAQKYGCRYHAFASGVCRGQNRFVNAISSICGITNPQMNCIRACLIESDKRARGNSQCRIGPTGCPDKSSQCTRKSCIDTYHCGFQRSRASVPIHAGPVFRPCRQGGAVMELSDRRACSSTVFRA